MLTVASAAKVDLTHIRAVQREWATVGLRARLQCVRKLRASIAEHAGEWLPMFGRSRCEAITSELIPLADACRFLERKAAKALQPSRCSDKGRALWARGISVELRHEPFGVILVVGPSNYPLFLAAVQCIQALVAGNAVLLKPGRSATAICAAFNAAVDEAGFPPGLLTLLPESPEAVHSAIAARCDKIVFTGSREAGVAVLNAAARQTIPVIAELSGKDPFIVLPSADIRRAAAALQFGLGLNNGNTCIAPQRVYAHASLAQQLRAMTSTKVVAFDTSEQAIEWANCSEYGLGASIFGDEAQARLVASRLQAGVVVINDVIAPTADPRVPFGGSKHSGYGRTRGLQGLLEMTYTKAVIVQRSGRLRHLEPLPENAEQLFLSYLKFAHSGMRSRFSVLGKAIASAFHR